MGVPQSHAGGTPVPGRSTPIPSGGYLSPMWDTPVPGRGYPSARWATQVPGGVPQFQVGYPGFRWDTQSQVVGTPVLGYPSQDWSTPGQDRTRVPARTDWSTEQNSRANNCCVTGSMPLAFVQEDFLVWWIMTQSTILEDILLVESIIWKI